MQAELSERFQSERAKYRLVFACESCVYYAPCEKRCSHGYPNGMHQLAAFEPGREESGTFCKEFEIA